MRWLVEKGDRVKSGQAVVEVETDKALTEIELRPTAFWRRSSPPAGTVVNLGAPLGILKPPV